MKRCAQCDEPLPFDAKACPHCGRKQSRLPLILLLCAPAAAALVIAVLARGGYLGKPRPAAATTQSAAATETVSGTSAASAAPSKPTVFTAQNEITAAIATQTASRTGLVRPGDTPTPTKVNRACRVSTSGNDLNMRAGPSTDYPVVGAVPNGTAITVGYIYNRWGFVSYGGTEGWCFMDYLYELY